MLSYNMSLCRSYRYPSLEFLSGQRARIQKHESGARLLHGVPAIWSRPFSPSSSNLVCAKYSSTEGASFCYLGPFCRRWVWVCVMSLFALMGGYWLGTLFPSASLLLDPSLLLGLGWRLITVYSSLTLAGNISTNPMQRRSASSLKAN